MVEIDIYNIGHKLSGDDGFCAYASYMTAHDGEDEIDYGISDKLDFSYTRNQCDLIAVIMGIRCIKDEYRDAQINLHLMPGYQAMMLDIDENGEWIANPKKNVEYVDMARDSIAELENVKVDKVSKNDAGIKACYELINQYR